MSDTRVSVGTVIKLGGAYMAFQIGSGFATGQEILQFFASYGYLAFGAIAVSLVIFTAVGASMMEAGAAHKLDTQAKAYAFYLGPLGVPLGWFNTVFMYSVFAIMLSGAGAIASEHYGMNPNIGSGIMAVLAVGTVLLGLRRMVDVIGFIGPVIIVFTIAVGLYGGLTHLEDFGRLNEVMETVQAPQAASNAWLSGLLYACYPLITFIPFLTSVGIGAPNARTARWGGAFGGLTLMTAVAIVTFGLLANFADIAGKEVPSLVLADQISPIFASLLTIILFAGIYTTAVPMLFMVVSRIGDEGSKVYNISSILLAIFAVVGVNYVPFGQLVGTVYPYTGYIGILILVLVVYKSVTRRTTQA